MQYCCFFNISTENVSIYVLSVHFTWTGWKDMQKKVVYSKVKKNCIFSQKNGFGFKSHNGVFCLHTEVTNWGPHSSHMHQMKLRYTGYIYRNTRTSCSFHKRSHCSFLQCGRPDFHHWKFPMKHVLLRSRYKTHTQFKFGITLKYLHSEISRKTQNVYRPLIHHMKFCTKNILLQSCTLWKIQKCHQHTYNW